MQWEIQLAGPSEDLKALEESMSASNIRIFSRNSQFFLEWDGFEHLKLPEEVFDSAKNLLQMLTGAARIAIGMRKPIEVAHIARYRPDGKQDSFSYVREIAFIRDSATISLTARDGSNLIVRPADPVPKWIDLALADSTVAKALRLVGFGIDDWVSLYRLFEVIVDNVGGIENIDKRGWVGKVTLKRFKHTANSPGTVGDDSRHGTEHTELPKKPIELTDAKAMVNLLLHEWLREKMP